MNCTICKKNIILEPSAAERAKSTGMPASYFTNIFTTHASCAIDKRRRDTSELMARTSGKKSTEPEVSGMYRFRKKTVRWL